MTPLQHKGEFHFSRSVKMSILFQPSRAGSFQLYEWRQTLVNRYGAQLKKLILIMLLRRGIKRKEKRRKILAEKSKKKK